jgi:type I restriction enzyme, S subunit
VPVPLPTEAEQNAIACFLEHSERHISRYIRAKQKLIALLNEQKQAIIYRGVTRGLDRKRSTDDVVRAGWRPDPV